jgi:alpha,alpha-trehalose phosphorylase
MALVYGFGGLRDHGGRLSFDPRLPEGWDRMRFRLTVRGRRIVVELTDREIRFDLTGDPIEVCVREVPHTLRGRSRTVVRLS